VYTQFSKNSNKVVSFYEQYFLNESVNLDNDLKAMFEGFLEVAVSPQLVLCSLKIMAKKYNGHSQSQGFIKNA
jgi:hypothetical protein